MKDDQQCFGAMQGGELRKGYWFRLIPQPTDRDTQADLHVGGAYRFPASAAEPWAIGYQVPQ